jgi:hypothetical protein
MTRNGRLATAAVVSLALHALVVASNWLPVPQPADTLRPLEARLAPPPDPKPAAPRPKVRAPRHAAPAPVPPVPTIAAVGPLPVPEPQPEAAPAEIAASEPIAPEPPQQLALAAESSAVVARTLPRRGRISYTILYGEGRTPVGTAVQSWVVESGSYTATSEAETTGLVEIFRPQRMRYASRGQVTAQGLRPESFTSSRTRRGQTDAAQARFDWAAGSLTYGNTRDQKSAALPAGTQDFMSFIYQFVLAPPAPGRHRVPLTNGSRFETYEIEVSEETVIETPLGTLRALPVRQLPRPGAESIEIWLATEYRYLPVRLRHFDRDGYYSGEQVANEIRISEE